MRRMICTTAATALLLAVGGVTKAETLNFDYKANLAGNATGYIGKTGLDQNITVKGAWAGEGYAEVLSDSIVTTQKWDTLKEIGFSSIVEGVAGEWTTSGLFLTDANWNKVTTLSTTFASGINGTNIWGLTASSIDEAATYLTYRSQYKLADIEGLVTDVNRNIESANSKYNNNLKSLNDLNNNKDVVDYRASKVKLDKGNGILADINLVDWAGYTDLEARQAKLVYFNDLLKNAGIDVVLEILQGQTSPNLGILVEKLNQVSQITDGLYDKAKPSLDTIAKLTAQNEKIQSDLVGFNALKNEYAALTYGADGFALERLSLLSLSRDSTFYQLEGNNIGVSLLYNYNQINSALFMKDIRTKAVFSEITYVKGGTIGVTHVITPRTNPSPVPEPTTLALAGVGALSVIARRGRRAERDRAPAQGAAVTRPVQSGIK